jgi:hypothetical protein
VPPKNNPLGLNPLQRKTLALLQELAKDPDCIQKDTHTGDVKIVRFPVIHGNHFHVGESVVLSKDATGLTNEAVWRALERKGLAQAEFPYSISLTAAGLAYDSGMREEMFQHPSAGGH